MIISGKEIRKHIENTLREKVNKPMRLDIIYVGENKAIEQYVRAKKKFGESIGILVVVHQFKESDTDTLISYIEEIAKESSGIIVQLPLPQSIDKQKVLDVVPINLDIDILSQKAQNNFEQGDLSKLPPVVGACDAIVSYYDIDLKDKNIIILGKGSLVGKPIASWLSNKNIVYTQMGKDDFNEAFLKNADIIFSGIGSAHFIKPYMVKDEVIIFDAGTSEDKETILGDVDPLVSEKALLFTPVPGGIGPLTVSSLFKNMF